MKDEIKKDEKYEYLEVGEGQPILALHGLMGGLSNFDALTTFFSNKGYKVILPILPLYSKTLLKTNVKAFSKWVYNFIKFKELKPVIVLGNSLGGHIGLYLTKTNPEVVKSLVITGSSGLYESAMGSGYTKRSDYEVIKKKAQDVFYNPEVATKEIVDEVYEIVNDRNKLIKTLAIAKSAIRHNMAKELPKIDTPTCIIWGKNDKVTPPEVADEFHALLPNSDLYWIDKCGHAAMMERPEEFNQILNTWLTKNNF